MGGTQEIMFRDGHEGGIIMQYDKNFRGDGYIHYLILIDIFMGVYVGKTFKYVLFIEFYYTKTVYKIVYAINRVLSERTLGLSVKALYGDSNEV